MRILLGTVETNLTLRQYFSALGDDLPFVAEKEPKEVRTEEYTPWLNHTHYSTGPSRDSYREEGEARAGDDYDPRKNPRNYSLKISRLDKWEDGGKLHVHIRGLDEPWDPESAALAFGRYCTEAGLDGAQARAIWGRVAGEVEDWYRSERRSTFGWLEDLKDLFTYFRNSEIEERTNTVCYHFSDSKEFSTLAYDGGGRELEKHFRESYRSSDKNRKGWMFVPDGGLLARLYWSGGEIELNVYADMPKDRAKRILQGTYDDIAKGVEYRKSVGKPVNFRESFHPLDEYDRVGGR